METPNSQMINEFSIKLLGLYKEYQKCPERKIDINITDMPEISDETLLKHTSNMFHMMLYGIIYNFDEFIGLKNLFEFDFLKNSSNYMGKEKYIYNFNSYIISFIEYINTYIYIKCFKDEEYIKKIDAELDAIEYKINTYVKYGINTEQLLIEKKKYIQLREYPFRKDIKKTTRGTISERTDYIERYYYDMNLLHFDNVETVNTIYTFFQTNILNPDIILLVKILSHLYLSYSNFSSLFTTHNCSFTRVLCPDEEIKNYKFASPSAFELIYFIDSYHAIILIDTIFNKFNYFLINDNNDNNDKNDNYQSRIFPSQNVNSLINCILYMIPKNMLFGIYILIMEKIRTKTKKYKLSNYADYIYDNINFDIDLETYYNKLRKQFGDNIPYFISHMMLYFITLIDHYRQENRLKYYKLTKYISKYSLFAANDLLEFYNIKKYNNSNEKKTDFYIAYEEDFLECNKNNLEFNTLYNTIMKYYNLDLYLEVIKDKNVNRKSNITYIQCMKNLKQKPDEIFKKNIIMYNMYTEMNDNNIQKICKLLSIYQQKYYKDIKIKNIGGLIEKHMDYFRNYIVYSTVLTLFLLEIEITSINIKNTDPIEAASYIKKMKTLIYQFINLHNLFYANKREKYIEFCKFKNIEIDRTMHEIMKYDGKYYLENAFIHIDESMPEYKLLYKNLINIYDDVNDKVKLLRKYAEDYAELYLNYNIICKLIAKFDVDIDLGVALFYVINGLETKTKHDISNVEKLKQLFRQIIEQHLIKLFQKMPIVASAYTSLYYSRHKSYVIDKRMIKNMSYIFMTLPFFKEMEYRLFHKNMLHTKSNNIVDNFYKIVLFSYLNSNDIFWSSLINTNTKSKEHINTIRQYEIELKEKYAIAIDMGIEAETYRDEVIPIKNDDDDDTDEDIL